VRERLINISFGPKRPWKKRTEKSFAVVGDCIFRRQQYIHITPGVRSGKPCIARHSDHTMVAVLLLALRGWRHALLIRILLATSTIEIFTEILGATAR
jgi:hypothetical protein